MLREACDGTADRLIGIGGGDLWGAIHADHGNLAGMGVRRIAQREAALDRLREIFGSGAVQRGLGFTPAGAQPRRDGD